MKRPKGYEWPAPPPPKPEPPDDGSCINVDCDHPFCPEHSDFNSWLIELPAEWQEGTIADA